MIVLLVSGRKIKKRADSISESARFKVAVFGRSYVTVVTLLSNHNSVGFGGVGLFMTKQPFENPKSQSKNRDQLQEDDQTTDT